jgi:hypothetical protein
MRKGKDWMEFNHDKFHHQVNYTYKALIKPERLIRYCFVAEYTDENGEKKFAKTEMGKWLDEVFKPKLDVFNSAFVIWEDEPERTRARAGALYDARKALEPLYRQLFNMIKGSPFVNEPDCIAMHLPITNKKRERSHEIKTNPYASIGIPTPNSVSIRYRDSDMERRGRPPGTRGVEIRWGIYELHQPPGSYDDFPHTTTSSKSPARIEFDYAARGKMLYLILRWENMRGEKGPWSTMYQVIVP